MFPVCKKKHAPKEHNRFQSMEFRGFRANVSPLAAYVAKEASHIILKKKKRCFIPACCISSSLSVTLLEGIYRCVALDIWVTLELWKMIYLCNMYEICTIKQFAFSRYFLNSKVFSVLHTVRLGNNHQRQLLLLDIAASRPQGMCLETKKNPVESWDCRDLKFEEVYGFV